MSQDTTDVSRRTVLKGAGGALGAGAALGATAGGASAQPSFGGWMEGANNYDGVVDRTGKDTVTVEVGAGNTGLAFAPAAVRVDPGTTVEWKWTGKGGSHNVHAKEGASFESDLYSKSGVNFTHTFESKGVVKYQCDPHAPIGMKGVVVVGDVQVGGGTPTGDGGGGGTGVPDFGGWLETANNYDGGVVDKRGQDTVTVEVGAGPNNIAFGPAAVWIDQGATIEWKWTGRGGSHNVHAMKGASFESDLYSESGVHFSHTFEEGGIVKYQCDPHAPLGMLGAVAVGDDVPMKGGGAGGDGKSGTGGFTMPTDRLGSLLLGSLFGVSGLAALLVLAVEAYGGGRGHPTEAGETGAQAEATATTSMTTSDEGIVREIGHDEFDPTGTATLIAIYFLILVVMWVFMYFVEFLNNGPTVIG